MAVPDYAPSSRIRRTSVAASRLAWALPTRCALEIGHRPRRRSYRPQFDDRLAIARNHHGLALQSPADQPRKFAGGLGDTVSAHSATIMRKRAASRAFFDLGGMARAGRGDAT